jgi:hypothetical protein
MQLIDFLPYLSGDIWSFLKFFSVLIILSGSILYAIAVIMVAIKEIIVYIVDSRKYSNTDILILNFDNSAIEANSSTTEVKPLSEKDRIKFWKKINSILKQQNIKNGR